MALGGLCRRLRVSAKRGGGSLCRRFLEDCADDARRIVPKVLRGCAKRGGGLCRRCLEVVLSVAEVVCAEGAFRGCAKRGEGGLCGTLKVCAVSSAGGVLKVFGGIER